MTTMTKRSAVVEIVYIDAGGGHRSAMNALKEVLAERHPGWQIRPVDLQKLLEPIDPIHRITERITRPLQRVLQQIAPKLALEPVQAQDIYNTALKRGATRGLGAILPILQAFIRHYADELEEILRQHWRRPGRDRPDLVISVIPNFNGVMFRALRDVHPAVPYVTVMTDMVDCPPNFWMEDQDQIMIAGTPRAFAQAKASGFYHQDKVFEVSGMMLKKSFYEQPDEPRLTYAALGLSPDRPTGLIMFGGNGSRTASLDILARFDKARLDVQTIVMCGNNRKLHDSLQGRTGCHAAGFVSNVADYMRLADFVIGKPGPGSISEAVHMGCPVIVERNAKTMPQERPNVDWILQRGVGISVKSFEKQIVGAVQRVLGDIETYRRNIDANVPRNGAVFEVADRIAEIMTTSDARTVARALPVSSDDAGIAR